MLDKRAPLFFFAFSLLLAGCSGGSGNSTPPMAVAEAPATDTVPDAQGVSFAEDIEPIINGKCIACHNGAADSIGPLDLRTESQIKSFASAIVSTLEKRSMPPIEVAQLTPNERAKFMAWLTGTTYHPVLSRVGLINQNAWDIQTRNRDTFISHRPSNVSCPMGSGWEVEDGELEVDTEFCNYLSLSQQLLLDLDAGQEVEVTMSYSDLTFNAPATAHFAVAMGGIVVMERDVAIPSDGGIVKQRFKLSNSLQRGDEIELHLHNHGENSWTIHNIDTFIEGEPADLDFCPSFDSTFEAIQETVFEAAGCTNSLCHGGAAAGGLDLSSDVAYQNILDVKATGSSLSLIKPRKPNESYLYQKLAEKTFPGSYDIGGSPMPSAGDAISAGQLEAIRVWIEAGAPETGSIGDTIGRGENELEKLLGVCLPEPEAVGVTPLQAPPASEGVQFKMPDHEINAESERELCFATYYDFRDQVPAKFLDETADHIFVRGQEVREDAFTHHNIMLYSGLGADSLADEAFGEWTCSPNSGDLAGQACEPIDPNSCGTGLCRSEPKDTIACRGFGPEESSGGVLGGLGVNGGINEPGFFKKVPAHGIFYWNSHAFNLTNEDALHRVWRNLFFTEDLRFGQDTLGYAVNIFKASGVAPFTKQNVCADFVFDEGDQLLELSSHTHKRGGLFTMFRKDTGEQIYESYNYDEPVRKRFDPPLLFDAPEEAGRTIEYCAEYNNGLNPDGSMNLETVTRRSFKPERSRCKPTACTAGLIGQACDGTRDAASCDTSPGAGDGQCDACPISPGVTSDDEMFLPLITRLIIDDDEVAANAAKVEFLEPTAGQSFAAGDAVSIELGFENFMLMEPAAHGADANHDTGHENQTDDSEHATEDEDHNSVSSGHFHLYLDSDDDADEHITAWDGSLLYLLPTDIAPGEHTFRVSLRAHDHHPLGIETQLTFVVE